MKIDWKMWRIRFKWRIKTWVYGQPYSGTCVLWVPNDDDPTRWHSTGITKCKHRRHMPVDIWLKKKWGRSVWR